MKQTDISVLQKAKPSDVSCEPFPHLIIENALPQELATKLTNSFPTNLFLNIGNNKRADISANDALEMSGVPKVWREFLDFHSSQAFFDQFLNLFRAHLEPAVNESMLTTKDVCDATILRRTEKKLQRSEFSLDAQISINTPVTEVSSVRSIHVDAGDKLFSALYYLRQPNDNTTGGDLSLFEWKNSKSKSR